MIRKSAWLFLPRILARSYPKYHDQPRLAQDMLAQDNAGRRHADAAPS
jgi:hypothetical protein